LNAVLGGKKKRGNGKFSLKFREEGRGPTAQWCCGIEGGGRKKGRSSWERTLLNRDVSGGKNKKGENQTQQLLIRKGGK